MTRPRILYIARAYPPSVGGLEQFAFHHLAALRDVASVDSIVNVHGKRALPLFLASALAEGVARARSERRDAIILADALLAPLGVALRQATGVPVLCCAHGLDVTYPPGAYQAVIRRALEQVDLVVCSSGATERATRERAPGARTAVVPLGLNPLPDASPRAIARVRAAVVPAGGRIVLTVGRLVRRKGAAWFAGQVLPLLAHDVRYAVVGEGPERDAILSAAHLAGVHDRVRLLGRVDEATLAGAYAASDAFVMPNIDVPGDPEGFGLVALEAAAAGVPVVAAGLQGITEAIHDGRNGALVAPHDAPAFAAATASVLDLPPSDRRALGERAAAYTRATFGWEKVAARHLALIERITQRRLVA